MNCKNSDWEVGRGGGGSGLVQFGSGKEQVVGFHENGNESSVPQNEEDFLTG
jgi:hypothetical protein